MDKGTAIRTVDHDAIDAFAQFAIDELRKMHVPDEQILAHFLHPEPVADARFERTQRIQNNGRVPAPARSIKARMRELLAN